MNHSKVRIGIIPTTNPKKYMIKLIVEFVPLIVFLATYKFSNIFLATLLMLLATSLGLIMSYIIDKKISMPLLISGFVLFTTGGITLFSGDSSFIKMKPTIVFVVFSVILFLGLFSGQGLVKHVLSSAIKMDESAWRILSFRFAIFLLSAAILNELVWRNFSENFWVNFKVFGFGPISFIFIVSQMPFVMKNQKN
ncbi:MAG: septation protein A [Rickettsiaceae bacterium]|nr:septation protein A [Rickettsiaceae bacterium]